MRVSLIKDKKIQDLILPNHIEGSYWISDIDYNGIKRNLISIEAETNNWKLISNNEVYFVQNNMMQPYVFLKNNSFYYLRNDIEKKDLLIFCSNVKSNYNCYDIGSYLEQGISIGSSNDCLINYKSIEPNAVLIKKENNEIYVIDNNSKYGVYVNNIRINNKKQIKTGDVIFIIGLKMILVISKGESKDDIQLLVNDLDNSNVAVKLMSKNLISLNNDSFTEDENEIEIPLYDENEYFHKVPRFITPINKLELKVDSPPAKVEEQNNPVILTIGPMITMSMISMVTGLTALNNVLSGNTTWERALPSLVICVAMFASVFVWPLFTKAYTKRQRKKNEKMRQEKYGAYIEEKRNTIVEAKKEQTIALNNNHPSTKECEEIILNRYTTLWQRRIEDEDYLKINLGKGSYPMKIDIKYPEEHFSMVEDNLKEMVSKLGNEPKLLSDVPVPFSFLNNYISGIIGDEQVISDYMKSLLIQILAFHSYDDLKIIILTDDEKEYNWKFLKDIPHIFTDDKSLRFFATNNNEYKEVCYYLDRVFNSRKDKFRSNEPKAEDLDKIYLIITDCFKKVRDFDIIEKIVESKKNYGFSLCILEQKLTSLPDNSMSFIEVNKNSGELHNKINYNETLKFSVDFDTVIDYETCAKKLANIPIVMDSNDEGQLPNKLGFLEMYDVGKIEQLNSLSRWKLNNPMLNLSAPIGSGKNGEIISIDLHEKYHGPHGLIAGMTGSGKSEFIITYILSMAINYHPYEVQFILIDYKGGGLAGAFENKNTGLKLPHLVGTITNLDVNEIKRSLASVESELKRRQALFNKAREISGESTIDIYKYQQMYRDRIVTEPVSHLFIICDEFAELKTQQPEFMEQLISTARIGRSLGVHLILATQKPSGIVDPQIWSNTRFRICMRVQEKSDSNEVIKCPDAAFLKQTGRFYFQVGYNEVFVLGQAAWAGGKYFPAEKVKKNIDTSLNFIDNIGYSIKKVETKEKVEVVTSNGEELINIVKYLNDLAKRENIKCRPLWLEKIPNFIKVEDLVQKYNYQKSNFELNPIIGEYDIPSMQEQKLLTVPISKDGNVLVYGTSGSGKENFITTLLYSSMLYYTPEEINYYIIDFGTGTLKSFKECPIVGDILYVDDKDKINNLYKLIASNIEKRKELFSEYNGDYYTYIKNSGKTVPNIVIIINNYESYQETYPEFDDELIILSRECNKYGIYFVLTVNTPNGVRFKLRQNFSQNFVLEQNSYEDYTTILGNVHKNYPAKIFGRGIIKTDAVYEFQTAIITELDTITQYIKEKCTEYSLKYPNKAKPVPTLPKIVGFNEIKAILGKTNELIIGLDKDNLEVCTFDFHKNYATIVTSLDIELTSKFINPFINQINYLNNTSLLVINADSDYKLNSSNTNYEYIDKNFDDIFIRLNNFIQKQNEVYKENHYDKSIFAGKKGITCIIIGIDSFKNKLSSENKTSFGELFMSAKELGIIDFIFVDSVDKFKKFELESWYKNTMSANEGIWIGNGINDQFSLKVSQKIPAMKEEVQDNFCFVVERGKPRYVKYVENFEEKR